MGSSLLKGVHKEIRIGKNLFNVIQHGVERGVYVMVRRLQNGVGVTRFGNDYGIAKDPDVDDALPFQILIGVSVYVENHFRAPGESEQILEADGGWGAGRKGV